MKPDVKPETEIGVIIGRFQVHELHAAHIDLITRVKAMHKKLIIFLGCSPVLGSRRNPLDFVSRRNMIQKDFPEAVILPAMDQSSDEVWSQNLDKAIRNVFAIGKATLYGGRDSFIPHYKGIHATHEIEQDVYVSGTEIRKEVSEDIKSSADWRAGNIYQAYNQFPISFQTVDIAVRSNDKDRLLMARKPNETLYRFVGGFVDPTDKSLEMAARREFGEETGGAEIGNQRYVGSFRVDDWRYRSERNRIMTALFLFDYQFGELSPSDDISELKWFKITDLQNNIEQVVPEHRELLVALLTFINNEK